MADDIVLNPGAGGDTTRAIDKTGVKTQVVTIDLGGSGAEALTSGTLPVSGTITAVTAITNALPAGTNAIGKLAANSGVDIGDVDVTSLPALPAGNNNIGDVDIASIAAGDNNIGNVDVVTLPALPAGTNNIGDVDVLTVPAPLSTTGGGTEAAALRVTIASDSTGVLSVDDNGGAITVDNGGTFATQVDGAALTALQLIDDPVIADDAAFTVGTSKVMMSGGQAVAHSSAPDAADALDAVAFIGNRDRVQFVIGGHPNVVTVKHTTITTAVTDAAIITISTGSKIVVTRISVTLDSASTVFPSVLIGFGTANTPTTTGVIASHGGVPAGGGFTIGDGSGMLGVGADNEDLRVTTTGNATGNGLQIVVSYYTIPS